MPTGNRIRANNIYGTVSDNPLILGAAAFNSFSLPLLPVVASAHAVVVLDPQRVYGNPEIIIVTAHTSVSSVATILRGQYGTLAREHPLGTTWAHVPMDEDFTKIATSVTRPSNPYSGQMIYETDTIGYQFWNGSAWTGVVPSFGTPVSVGDTISNGVAATLSRSDHLHDRGIIPAFVSTGTAFNVSGAGAENSITWDEFGGWHYMSNITWSAGTPTIITFNKRGFYVCDFRVQWAANGTGTRSIKFVGETNTIVPPTTAFNQRDSRIVEIANVPSSQVVALINTSGSSLAVTGLGVRIVWIRASLAVP